jgi:hypothetical protein
MPQVNAYIRARLPRFMSARFALAALLLGWAAALILSAMPRVEVD